MKCKRNEKRDAYLISFVGNLFLFLLKLVCSVVFRSTLLFSDSIHSLTDVLITSGAFAGDRISAKKPDKTHHYGYYKASAVTSLFISVLLIVTGITLLFSPSQKPYKNSSYIIVYATCIACVIIKEILFRITAAYAKRNNSMVLKAEAYHHRSDSLSSFAALIGTVCEKIGVSFAEKLSLVIISAMIVITGLKILVSSVKNLSDRSAPDCVMEKIKQSVNVNDKVNFAEVKTRVSGEVVFADVYLRLDVSSLDDFFATLKEVKEGARALEDENISVNVVPIENNITICR